MFPWPMSRYEPAMNSVTTLATWWHWQIFSQHCKHHGDTPTCYCHSQQRAAQDIKGNGQVHITMRFSQKYRCALRGCPRHFQWANRSRPSQLSSGTSRIDMLFHAEIMGDIMYFHPIRQSDAWDFVMAVMTDIEVHNKNDHWLLVKREEVPLDTDRLPSDWAMCCKRILMTNKVKGWKARLNIHGGEQVYGANYFVTYAPSCDMVQIYDHTCYHPSMGDATDWICASLCSSYDQMWPVHWGTLWYWDEKQTPKVMFWST